MVKRSVFGGLASLLAGATALVSGTVLAGPIDVYNKVLAENPVYQDRYLVNRDGFDKITNNVQGATTAVVRVAESITNSPKGYSLTVEAVNIILREPNGKTEERKELNFYIEDPSIKIDIKDDGANGLSEFDSFSLKAKLSHSNSVSTDIWYEADGDYCVQGYVEFGGDGKNKRPQGTGAGFRRSDISPWPLRKLVDFEANPTIKMGQQFYNNLTKTDGTNTVNLGQTIDLVYEDFKGAVRKMEEALVKNEEAIRSGENCNETLKVFGQMGKDYRSLVEKRLASR